MSEPATKKALDTLTERLRQPAVGLVAFIVVFSVFLSTQTPSFLSLSNWYYLLDQTVILALLGMGLTIVIISRGLDLSVGSVLGLSGAVAASFINNGVPMPVAFAAALATGTGLGIVNGLVITKLRVPPFIATLAMLTIARGVLFVWTQAIPLSGYMNGFYYHLGGLSPIFGARIVSLPVLVTLVVASIIAAILRWTQFGRHVYAVGSNPEAAELSGINVDRIKISVYAISGLLAALAGIIMAGRLTTVHPEMGLDLELTAIAVAIIGGAALSGGQGGIFGALAGALTFTLIQNSISILNLDPTWENVVIGAAILLAILVDRVFRGGRDRAVPAA